MKIDQKENLCNTMITDFMSKFTTWTKAKRHAEKKQRELASAISKERKAWLSHIADLKKSQKKRR